MNYTIENHILHQGGQPVSWKESPNHGGVMKSIDLVVIHYTASDGLQGTINWLCTPQGEKSVSAHLVISRTGVVWQLVPFNLVAWHVGYSEWDGRRYCNKFAVGIENMGWGTDWPEAQVQANIDVLVALHGAYPTIYGVAGHDDVALPPGRKVDPGPNFPWDRVFQGLSEAGVRYE